MSELRILGLTTERVADFRSAPGTKSAGLFTALDRQYEVVDVVRPEPPRPAYYLNKLRHLRPTRDRWRQAASLNPDVFRLRTRLAAQEIERREGQYDLIVQLHTLVAPGWPPTARRYVLHTDNTYLLSERAWPDWAPLRGAQRAERVALERATFQAAAALFPRSEWLRRSLIDDYGCDPERVIRVGGGANVVAPSIAHKDYAAPIALFVGQDFARKGGHVLLDAWSRVRRHQPDAELWIVGPPKPLAPPEPGVRWLRHITSRAALADLYMRASIFVLPSLFEPWGHVLLEAMGHGLPCIGTDACAMPEIITAERTGLLVPSGAAEPLAAALGELLADPALRAAYGQRAYAEVRREHSWDDVVARMQPHIAAACGAAPQAAAV